MKKKVVAMSKAVDERGYSGFELQRFRSAEHVSTAAIISRNSMTTLPPWEKTVTGSMS